MILKTIILFIVCISLDNARCESDDEDCANPHKTSTVINKNPAELSEEQKAWIKEWCEFGRITYSRPVQLEPSRPGRVHRRLISVPRHQEGILPLINPATGSREIQRIKPEESLPALPQHLRPPFYTFKVMSKGVRYSSQNYLPSISGTSAGE